jgi:hypothetical protein
LIDDINNVEQQAISDIAWLAGFWDADGNISLFKRNSHLVPSCSCCNTNKKMIDNVMRILDAAEIPYYLEYQDRGGRKNHKPAWTVKLESRPRVQAFLKLVRNYLVGKQEQADLVLKWCDLPKATSIGGGRGVGSVGVNYADGYWEIKDTLSALNAKGRIRD